MEDKPSFVFDRLIPAYYGFNVTSTLQKVKCCMISTINDIRNKYFRIEKITMDNSPRNYINKK